MTLYHSYQLVGGEENWEVTQSTTDFNALKPTFITVLATDVVLTKSSVREMIDGARYLGPMYFDLDSEDISASIAGAKKLVVKLKAYGLEDTDIEVYLSGKKGLHILIQPSVFMDKPVPVSKLPTIYKEIAFIFAVDTVDFAVYSARRGRMFRTCYNVRENGNYKVPITCAELSELDSIRYNELCKSPRTVLRETPNFRPKLAIVYDELKQKIVKLKKVKPKPVDAQTLKGHLPIVQRLMKGEGVKEGIGFNKIAIQLAIYAHAAKLSEDQLITQCAGLIEKHHGDGQRYNSVFKRTRELSRMFNYLEDNSGYDYALGPIAVMLTRKEESTDPDDPDSEDDFDEEVIDTSGGIFEKGVNYFVGGDEEKLILDALFKEPLLLHSVEDGKIICMSANIQVQKKTVPAPLELSDFGSSSSLHKRVNSYGAAFTGTDTHAKCLYRNMVREAKLNGVTVYATDKEGLNVLNMPFSDIVEARDPFTVWADASGVRIPQTLKDQGLEIRFVGFPDPQGSIKTDLAKAPTFPVWASQPGNRDDMLTMLRSMLLCQEPAILAKMLGWAVACFYSQLFRRVYRQFPLMHINGTANSGKSQMMFRFMKLFFYKGQETFTSPNAATKFALAKMVSESASIPVMIDEYKVASMGMNKHEEMKDLFRLSYNGGYIVKGGGNRGNDNFGALSKVTLTGPIVFLAEAIEQESATLMRCVVVTIKLPAGRLRGGYTENYKRFEQHERCLGIIGQHIAATVIQNVTLDDLKTEFDPILKVAMDTYFTPNSADPPEVANQKTKTVDRIVYNHAVAYYGLLKFKEAICTMFPAEAGELSDLMSPLENSVFTKLDIITDQTTAEFIKVLQRMSDMTRFADGESGKISNKLEYELGNIGEKSTISLVARLAYNKYREYCKRLNEAPLFNGEASFVHALKDCNIFVQMGIGTTRLIQESVILDYEQMMSLGVPAFSK